jgi:hypothetical protein
MNKSAVFVVALFAASLTQAQNQPVTKPADTTATTDTAAATVTPAKPADAKAAPAAPGTTAKTPVKKDDKKKVEEPKIPGVTIARANGTYLGLEVVNADFKLSFYDKKKKLMAPDVTRASARWPNPRSVLGPNRTILNSNGSALIGSKPVVPPFTFLVHLSLMQGDGDESKVVENYDVAFHN